MITLQPPRLRDKPIQDMTLREYYIGQALKGCAYEIALSLLHPSWEDEMAKRTVVIADAVLSILENEVK